MKSIGKMCFWLVVQCWRVRWLKNSIENLPTVTLVSCSSSLLPNSSALILINVAVVDLFIVGIQSEEEATAKVKEIYESVCRAVGRKALVIRTLRAITILGRFPERHIQIILRMYRTPTEVLLGFDIDSCAIGYDGSTTWATERCQVSNQHVCLFG